MILLGRRRIVYVPIPKNASSSVMMWLFPFEYGAEPEQRLLHQIWPCVANGGRWIEPMPGYFSFAVLRDPLERFVSGYNNRVVCHRTLSSDTPWRKRLGLSRKPDINEFARKLPRYRQAFPDIGYHFMPQWDYLRRVANRLTRIYSPATLELLRADVAEYCGVDPGPIGRRQTGGHNPGLGAALEPRALRALRRWYKVDFKLVPELLERSGTAGAAGPEQRIEAP